MASDELEVNPYFKVINITPEILWEHLGLPVCTIHSFNLEVLGEMMLWPTDVLVVANLVNEPGYISLLLYSERFATMEGPEVSAQYRTDKNGHVQFNRFTQPKVPQ